MRWRVAVVGAGVIALRAYATVGPRFSGLVPQELATSELAQSVSAVVVIGLALLAAHRYFQGYRRSGLPMCGAVTLGSLLIAQAQISMHFGAMYRGAFWLYHVELLLGFGAILWGLYLEYDRGRNPVGVIQDLTLSDPIEQIRAGYSESIRSFAAALEARDGYTLGHGERVASLAVLIGEALRLSPERLRSLYQGSLLHDVGKIGVRDAILHKPGDLTDEEFGVNRDHPVRGEAMLAAVVGNAGELAVILHHHERFDGSGYPHGLAGDAIPTEARIAAADDAPYLAYRPAA